MFKNRFQSNCLAVAPFVLHVRKRLALMLMEKKSEGCCRHFCFVFFLLRQKELPTKKDCPHMCAYKLVTVKFKWWGLQNKVENFIQKVCWPTVIPYWSLRCPCRPTWRKQQDDWAQTRCLQECLSYFPLWTSCQLFVSVLANLFNPVLCFPQTKHRNVLSLYLLSPRSKRSACSPTSTVSYSAGSTSGSTWTWRTFAAWRRRRARS